MTVDAGTRLGSYEILSAIGAGGMGELYRLWPSPRRRLPAVPLLGSAWRRYQLSGAW
jgi:hypothetical protein